MAIPDGERWLYFDNPGGDTVPGFSIYGIVACPQESTDSPRCNPLLFGSGHFDYCCPLSGPGWGAAVWDVELDLREIPVRRVLEIWHSFFEQVLALGYDLAWIGLDFVDPPYLFDPDCMGESVSAACSRSIGLVVGENVTAGLSRAQQQGLRSVREIAVLFGPS